MKMELKSKMERNRKMPRILPVFAMAFAILMLSPITAKAEIKTGNCGANGSNVTYSYNTETHKLTISGEGAMEDYDSPFFSSIDGGYNSYLETVEIGYGVKSIGAYAFTNCYNLKNVTIKESVTQIGKCAFFGCIRLEKVESNNIDTVTSIGANAFMSCEKLSGFTLPKDLGKIERATFSGCKNLTSITIPDSVESIGDSAFANSGLKNVTIPNKVTIIDERVFFECKSLTNVTIPDSVTSIGDYAFDYCEGLKNVMIPNSVTSIGDWAFSNSGLTSITIPGSVQNIGRGAFTNCSGLKNVSIPDSVSNIGDYAFGFNYAYSESELIPDFVISCNQGSAAEAYVKKSGVKFVIKLSSYPPTGTDFTYNGSVRTGVPQEEYYTITENTGVDAGNYTAAITLKDGYRWPDGTNSNKTVEWTIKPAPISPAAVEVADQTYTGKPLTPQPTVKIADKTLIKNTDYTVSYSDNTNVGEATITITGSGNYTGTKMANFTIAEGKAPNPGSTDSSAAPVKTGDEIKDTKTKATYLITSTKTNNLTVTYVSPVSKTAPTLTVPDTVAIKGKNYKVTEIKANAFKNNKKLKKITIGKNIKKIGKNAFSGCKNLKTVTIKTTKLTKKTVGTNAFKNIHAKAKVKVPKSKLKSYKTILKARGIKGKNQKITK